MARYTIVGAADLFKSIRDMPFPPSSANGKGYRVVCTNQCNNRKCDMTFKEILISSPLVADITAVFKDTGAPVVCDDIMLLPPPSSDSLGVN